MLYKSSPSPMSTVFARDARNTGIRKISRYLKRRYYIPWACQISRYNGRPLIGRPFLKRFALCYRTVVLSCPILSVCLSVCNVSVLWPNGWINQDETWHSGRPRPRPYCVRLGLRSAPSNTRHPIFGPFLLWPNGWTDQDAT